MSLINRPFRGFSGVYTRPDFDLDSSPRSSTSSIPHPDFAPSPSPPTTPSPQQQNPQHQTSTHKSRRSFNLFTRSKSSKHLHATAAADADRPAPPCRAHTAELPPPPAPPRHRLAALLRRGSKGEERPSPEEMERELEELYVAVYSKAERRAFFREWKAREEMRDAWEVEALERGVVYGESDDNVGQEREQERR